MSKFSLKLYTYLMAVFILAETSVQFATSKPLQVSGKSELTPFLNKKYELATSDDNFEKIMETLGVGVLKKNLAKLAKPVMELTEKDGEYTLTSESTFKNTVTKFRLDKEFEEETPDGRHVKSMFIQDKNKLTQIQHGDKTTTIVREFFPEEVKVTVQVDDIVSVRTYKLM